MQTRDSETDRRKKKKKTCADLMEKHFWNREGQGVLRGRTHVFSEWPLTSATEISKGFSKGAGEEEEEGRKMNVSWALNNCCTRGDAEGGMRPSGRGTDKAGGQGKAIRSQLSTMTRKLLGLAGAEASFRKWVGREMN